MCQPEVNATAKVCSLVEDEQPATRPHHTPNTDDFFYEIAFLQKGMM